MNSRRTLSSRRAYRIPSGVNWHKMRGNLVHEMNGNVNLNALTQQLRGSSLYGRQNSNRTRRALGSLPPTPTHRVQGATPQPVRRQFLYKPRQQPARQSSTNIAINRLERQLAANAAENARRLASLERNVFGGRQSPKQKKATAVLRAFGFRR